MLKTLIIGKNSNLSQQLCNRLENVSVVSSREILHDITILSSFKNEKINLVFNNFQPATRLNDISNTQEYIINSILITSKVLEYFKNSSINKIIYTSSSSVYGNNILCKESDELKPLNLHASLKVASEKLIEKFCNEHQIDYTIARIFNIYGGDDTFSVISKMINAVKNKEELTIVNNGNAIRDFIHIDDVVNIYSKLLSMKDIKIINIGTGEGVSIKTILDMLKNSGFELKTNNIERDELKISTADNSLLFDLVGRYCFKNMEQYLKKKLQI